MRNYDVQFSKYIYFLSIVINVICQMSQTIIIRGDIRG